MTVRQDSCRPSTGISQKNCLILSASGCIGDKLASQLEKYGWRTDVVHSDVHAYERIQRGTINVVIADIDAVDLGGLALLAYCHHSYPSITTHAIAPADDGYRKKLARDLGGCQSFIYLLSGSHEIDFRRGMAMDFARGPGLSLPDV